MMKVYALNIKGVHSVNPKGCMFPRGHKMYLATPYGVESLTDLATQNNVVVEDLLVERDVPPQVQNLLTRLMLVSRDLYQLTKDKERLEQTLNKTKQYTETPTEIQRLTEAIKESNVLFDKLRANYLGNYSVELNHRNLRKNLRTQLPVRIVENYNSFKLCIQTNQVKDVTVNNQPIYNKNGVIITYETNQVNIGKVGFGTQRYEVEPIPELIVNVQLPEENKPSKEEHLQPVTDAIQKLIIDQLLN